MAYGMGNQLNIESPGSVLGVYTELLVPQTVSHHAPGRARSSVNTPITRARPSSGTAVNSVRDEGRPQSPRKARMTSNNDDNAPSNTSTSATCKPQVTRAVIP